MKKFFTSIALAAMAIFSANAEIETAHFQTWSQEKGYEDYYKPFDLTLLKVADGVYQMPNFMNSGAFVNFSFTEPEVGKQALVTLTSPVASAATAWDWGTGYEDWYLLQYENGDNLEISRETVSGEDVVLYDPIMYTQHGGYLYSFVEKLDTSNGQNDYGYYFFASMYAYDANGVADYYYLSFYFDDEKEISGALTSPAYYGYYNSELEWTYALDFESKIVKNEDGSLTILDFLNSGYPASFKFDEIEVGGYGSLTMCGNILQPAGYDPYLMTCSDYEVDEDGWPVNWTDYMVCYYIAGENENATTIYRPYIWQRDINYTFVYRNDLEANPNYYEYYACFAVGGDLWTEEGWVEDGSWGYAYYYFDMPEYVESGVKTVAVEAENDAWYTLQGVKVNAPTSKGIYIHNGKKVVVK